MKIKPFEHHHKKSETPNSEVDFLHKEILKRQETLGVLNEGTSVENIAEDVVRDYGEKKPEDVIDEGLLMDINEIKQKVLNLSPEHDRQISELVLLVEEKGIKNAISVVQKKKDAHLGDDFHRFLVQYLVRTKSIPGIKEGTSLFKAIDMKLYQVVLPRIGEEGKERSFSELVSSMEQFYAGMLSVSEQEGRIKEKNHFTLELALSNFSDEVVFYCSVPSKKSDLFKKHLTGVFPYAVYGEIKEDYNPFQDGGAYAGSVARLSDVPIFPIKTYEKFEYDPFNIVLSTFAKIKKEGEGASIQLVLSPCGNKYNQKYNSALEKIKNGVKSKKAYKEATRTIGGEVLNIAKDIIFSSSKKTEKKDFISNNKEIDYVYEKVNSPIVSTNIRIVSSAENYNRAKIITEELESAFNQFRKADSNSIIFTPLTDKALSIMIHNFSFRLFNEKETIPLNLTEITTMMHFPVSMNIAGTLKEAKSKTAPPPLSLPKEGVLVGINEHNSEQTKVRFSEEDRMRHFYVIGQTGTGKTTILKNMIIQDIENGEGVCMIDPHGTDIQDVLANIPTSRIEDVIYFDPANTQRPMGLNMLEYDHNHPEQKTFVVNELFSIFQKLYGGNPESMGPMFEQYFRNATMLVIEDTESGNTLLEVSRVMVDAGFRKLKLSKCKNPIVVQFWKKIAGEAGGEAQLANIVPYITSKFDIFLANDIMRPIIAQEHSAFNLRNIMDERKILLINLSKGRLGDINAHLIGLILVGKILMAALSRVNTDNRPNFYLYIDEFQNVTTDSISTILSEARKYRLSLNMAHQFIGQLDEPIKKSVFGNVGSIAVFRTGAEDAEFLESQFIPVFSAKDIMNTENFNACIKLLVKGYPERPFNIKTVFPQKGSNEVAEKLKELSALKYGRELSEVEEEVRLKYLGG